jgi:hypothetical protein
MVMQFLWFLSHDDGSVTMKYRGEPDDWDDAVKSNLLMAVKDLLEGLTDEGMPEELVSVEELPEAVNNIIPYRPRSVKGS